MIVQFHLALDFELCYHPEQTEYSENCYIRSLACPSCYPEGMLGLGNLSSGWSVRRVELTTHLCLVQGWKELQPGCRIIGPVKARSRYRKRRYPNRKILLLHCIRPNHQQTLCKAVFKINRLIKAFIKLVNFIRSTGLNSSQLATLLEEHTDEPFQSSMADLRQCA
jgi:hypothetical protein